MLPSIATSPFPSLLDGWPSLFEDFARLATTNQGARAVRARLPITVYEFDDRYEIFVEAPGVQRENIQVEFEDAHLTVRVDHGSQPAPEGAKVLYAGRDLRASEQRIRLTDASDNIEATLKDGILKITASKRLEKQPRKIEVT